MAAHFGVHSGVHVGVRFGGCLIAEFLTFGCLSGVRKAHRRLFALFRFCLLVLNAFPSSPTGLTACVQIVAESINCRSIRLFVRIQLLTVGIPPFSAT